MTDGYLLLVEDRHKDELLIVRGLRKAGVELEIRVARDGLEALEMLHGRVGEAPPAAPRLVLMDIKLPRLDGLEVLARLRCHPATRCLPVVMLSSSDDFRDRSEACLRGANSYMRKPVSVQRLNDALAALARYWLEFHEPAL